jgi:glycosyltransferase involved in cell wall biosynthesis
VFCSVIIPTIGRGSLTRAVASVLDQDFTASEVEVIIVNDSGEPLDESLLPRSQRVRVITTQHRERSVARNTGAAMANGQYLCFLDDDDWLLPGAFTRWSAAACQAAQAAWVVGGIRVLDANGVILGEVNAALSGNCFAQIMGGAWAPIQASLIRAVDFFGVGGYDPSICGTEDLDLCRKIALRGEFAHTVATVACLLRGSTWTTSTDYGRAPADTLRSREAALSRPGSWPRLVSAARASVQPDYWFGRILRIYASTLRFALRQRQGFTAISRVLGGLVGMVAAGRHLFSRRFWQAAQASHVPGELHHIMQDYERGRGQRRP